MDTEGPLPFPSNIEPSPEFIAEERAAEFKKILAGVPDEAIREKLLAEFKKTGHIPANFDFEAVLKEIDMELDPESISERAELLDNNPTLKKVFEDSMGFLLYDAPPEIDVYKLPYEDRVSMILEKYPTPSGVILEIQDAYDETIDLIRAESKGSNEEEVVTENDREKERLDGIFEHLNELLSVLYRERYAAAEFIERNRAH